MFELLSDREHLLMERMIYLVSLLALSFTVSHVQAQRLGDPQGGLASAQQVCSECHAIRDGQVRSPNSTAPTFLELATAPGMTSAALTVALTTPHAGMPMFKLTADQREDLIAYILSLR
jgi:mono/diheme cytochrome c family protein